jgi:DNA-binding MarR family transcriptional regulator
MLTNVDEGYIMILYGTFFTPPQDLLTSGMTLSEVSKRTDKTPLGTLLSILTSFEVLARYLEVELKPYEVSLIRFNIMSTLFKNGGEMTPSEIAESVFREKNSITAVLNTLERQGVVRREPSTNDRRSVKVVITDKGWNEANRLNPIAQELSRKCLSCLEKGKVEDLVETMRTIRESLLPGISRTSGRLPAGTGPNDGGLQRNRDQAALNISNEGIVSL